MNDQERNELRVKVAELCGWKAVKEDRALARKVHTDPPYGWVGISPVVQKLDHGKDESKDFNYWVLPDYPNDLNAIQEAERAAFPDSVGDLILNDWAYNLYMECRANAEDKDVSLARATAEQRCRAFVATMERENIMA